MKTAKKKPAARAKKRSMPECNHMADMHKVTLPTIAVLSLVSAATYAVQNGYEKDEDCEFLEPAVNALLDQCYISCSFKKGVMTLTYDSDAYRAAKKGGKR